MKKILIEFFDDDYIENIIAALSGSFDRIIYFYPTDEKKTLEKSRSVITEFLQKKQRPRPEFYPIDPTDYYGIIEHLEQLTDNENEFYFDITGGTNMFIAALGDFVGTYPNVNCEIIMYDLKSGKFTSNNPDKGCGDFVLPKLRVEELVSIHTAKVIKDNSIIRYDLQKDNLREIIKKLWDVAGKNPKQWNVYHSARRCRSQRRVTDTVDAAGYDAYVQILNSLQSEQFVSKVREEKRSFSYNLDIPKSAFVIFEKSGNILELYTYLAAKECGIFTDITTGIKLDWDGKIEGKYTETTNEIDLLCTINYIPVFISCKNTVILKEYLYEIEALVKHYCGKYALKVIVSTVPTPLAVRTRAKDMGIYIIDDLEKISYLQFKSQLANIKKLNK